MRMSMDIEVIHNQPAHRFEARVGGELAVASYRLDGEVMAMVHTEVPEALEGRGIASRLVQAAFDHAQAQGLKIRPLCSYVAAWARRHPERAALLA
jgi:predicted GNAT family acetyltransferase